MTLQTRYTRYIRKIRLRTNKYDVENAVEHWKDAIYLEVINYEANKDVLELCPHIRF